MQNPNIKLTYRGVSYDCEPPTLDMVESSVGGQYRGRTWKWCYPRHVTAPPSDCNLQYRGVHYLSDRPVETDDRLSDRVTSTPKVCRAIVSEVAKTHRANLWKNLERRLQVAKSKGDKALVDMLEKESKQLGCLV